MSYNSEGEANRIFAALVGANNANLPDIDFTDDKFHIPWDRDHAVYKPVQSLDAKDITSGEVGGSGVFDVMMAGFAAHLLVEHERGRITGGEYAKAYVALTQGAMENAVQFLLGRDQAFWMAAKAQAEAITARVANEMAKVQAVLGRANYALTKLKLATEDAQFGAQEYQITNILPEQKKLVSEQAEAQRAQTLDKRSDTQTVTGLMGKQKELYSQQVTSYKEDVKQKNAKMLIDTWITRHTIDESIAPPWHLRTAALEKIVLSVRHGATGDPDDDFLPIPEDYPYTEDQPE